MHEVELTEQFEYVVSELIEAGMIQEASELEDAFVRLAGKRYKRRLRPWVYTVPLLAGGAWYAGHHPEPHVPAQPHKTHVQAPHTKPNPAHPANFNAFKNFTLESEGGYTHRKKSVDPGGATNFGITQKTYNEWQVMKHGGPLKKYNSVKHMSLDTAKTILRDLYWAKVHAKQLPESVAVAVADMGVLQGPGKAIKALQEALGLPQDGLFGQNTLNAVWNYCTTPEKDAELATKITNIRENQLRELPHAKANPGWFNRTEDMRNYVSDLSQPDSHSELAVTTKHKDSTSTQ